MAVFSTGLRLFFLTQRLNDFVGGFLEVRLLFHFRLRFFFCAAGFLWALRDKWHFSGYDELFFLWILCKKIEEVAKIWKTCSSACGLWERLGVRGYPPGGPKSEGWCDPADPPERAVLRPTSTYCIHIEVIHTPFAVVFEATIPQNWHV